MLGATMNPEPGQACSYFPLAMMMVARNVVSLCAKAHDISPGYSMGQWNLQVGAHSWDGGGT